MKKFFLVLFVILVLICFYWFRLEEKSGYLNLDKICMYQGQFCRNYTQGIPVGATVEYTVSVVAVGMDFPAVYIKDYPRNPAFLKDVVITSYGKQCEPKTDMGAPKRYESEDSRIVWFIGTITDGCIAQIKYTGVVNNVTPNTPMCNDVGAYIYQYNDGKPLVEDNTCFIVAPTIKNEFKFLKNNYYYFKNFFESNEKYYYPNCKFLCGENNLNLKNELSILGGISIFSLGGFSIYLIYKKYLKNKLKSKNAKPHQINSKY